eukprot:TRINITY_DN14480_c0_g1_i1.p2 TRINITY_DN14480_c0_g1~~TRINITY_DN14480_c0_g1_i1.p2  ORF type:complete len:243 (+),score=65.70 TRINITY_DN14480_c0_g1_i1:1722-2450(+)
MFACRPCSAEDIDKLTALHAEMVGPDGDVDVLRAHTHLPQDDEDQQLAKAIALSLRDMQEEAAEQPAVDEAGSATETPLQAEVNASCQDTHLFDEADAALQAALSASLEDGGATGCTSGKHALKLMRDEKARLREFKEAKQRQQKLLTQKAKNEKDTSKLAVEVTDAAQEVARAIAGIASGTADGQITLNFLSQDAACKKQLKPLQKKHGVKNINKAWLTQFPDILNVSEEGTTVIIASAVQ